jgi:hypothetical protein
VVALRAAREEVVGVDQRLAEVGADVVGDLRDGEFLEVASRLVVLEGRVDEAFVGEGPDLGVEALGVAAADLGGNLVGDADVALDQAAALCGEGSCFAGLAGLPRPGGAGAAGARGVGLQVEGGYVLGESVPAMIASSPPGSLLSESSTVAGTSGVSRLGRSRRSLAAG